MPEHTATVEVLTAEVRVLMVGSRQVTLSVVKQLDEIEPEEITPFGRITTGRKRDREEVRSVEVIGRAEDGSLARAAVFGTRHVCGSGFHEGSHYEVNGTAAIGGACDKHRTPGLPGVSSSQGHHFWAWFYPDKETLDAWDDLPLIVLAGLR